MGESAQDVCSEISIRRGFFGDRWKVRCCRTLRSTDLSKSHRDVDVDLRVSKLILNERSSLMTTNDRDDGDDVRDERRGTK